MDFCNSCGTSLQPGARFCPKCGTANPEVTPAAQPATVPQKRNDALKIVLIVVAVVVVLGIAGIGAATFIGLRIARHTRVEQSGKSVRVQTPFGTVETTKDPAAVVRNLGTEVYPGARIVDDGAANVQMGGMHTLSAEFESDDPASKIADFYKSKLPNANVTVSGEDHYTIVSTDKNNLITVNIEPRGDKSRIHIANVSGKGIGVGVGGGSSN